MRKQKEKAMRIIESGKNKGKTIAQCETSYLKWIATHEKVLAVRNRWMARDARFELARREESAKQAEIAARVDEQINEIIAKYPTNRYGISDISKAGCLNGSSQGFCLMR
jgi:hypothetical protein